MRISDWSSDVCSSDLDLNAWEEKDKTVDFKFVKKDGKRLYFSGLTFEQISKDELNIYLALRQRDGSLKAEVFRIDRKSVVQGKRVSVRVDLGGRRIIKKQLRTIETDTQHIETT